MNDQEPARACQHCGRFEAVGNRREFLKRAGGGLGLLALAGLMDHEGVLAADSTVHSPQSAVANPLAPRPGHFAAKARSVIWLFMEGGPSSFDLFDPKPELEKNHGKGVAIETFFGNTGPLLKSPFGFQKYGACGASVCEKYTNIARFVDDI